MTKSDLEGVQDDIHSRQVAWSWRQLYGKIQPEIRTALKVNIINYVRLNVKSRIWNACITQIVGLYD